MKKIWIVLVAAICGLAVGATFALTSRAEDGKKTEAEKPKVANAMTVSETTAQIASWPVTIEASGPIAAWQEAIIGAEISGQRLTEVLVNVGDPVKKDQLLATFNPDTLLAQQAELKANLAQANSDRERALSLKGSGAMSAQQIETYVNQAKIARARLDANTLQLKYTKITAPDDGVISARTATLGAVGATGQELFRLIRQNRLEWRGQLTAGQLAQILPDQTVQIKLPDGSSAEAVVRQTAPALDVQSRLATVYADIKEGSNARAGMYGNGLIELGERDALAVPAKSVVIRDGRSYVFILRSDGKTTKAVQVQVTAGRSKGEETEILSGLEAGARIAVKGAGFLNDGDSVGLVEAGSQP